LLPFVALIRKIMGPYPPCTPCVEISDTSAIILNTVKASYLLFLPLTLLLLSFSLSLSPPPLLSLFLTQFLL
jgi:hypothetical protein